MDFLMVTHLAMRMHWAKGSVIPTDWQNNLHLDSQTVKLMETLMAKSSDLPTRKVKETDFRSEIRRRKLTEIMTDLHSVRHWDSSKDLQMPKEIKMEIPTDSRTDLRIANQTVKPRDLLRGLCLAI